MGANETLNTLFFIMWVIITIVIVIFFVWLFLKIFTYFYKKANPNKKYLNKKMLKIYLKKKYGRSSKGVYKEITRELWDKYKIK